MDNPITVSLPRNLPTNWAYGQTVAPNGSDVGLAEQYGYNYLNQQINAAQQAAQEVGEAIPDLVPASDLGQPNGVAELDQNGQVPAGQLPPMNYDPAGSASAVQQNLTEHINNQDNPHGVTATQVGARPSSWTPTAAEVGAAVPSQAVNVTLAASSWSSANPPTLTISVPGLGAAQNGTIGVANGATQEQRKAAAAAQIGIQAQTAGYLTLVADGTKPTVNIPATVILLG